MWGFFEDVGSAIWGGITGLGTLLSELFGILGDLLSRIISLGDLILTLLGIMPEKKMRVAVKILQDSAGPVLDIVDAEPMWKLTKQIYLDQANVKILPPGDHDPVAILKDEAPDAALEPGCGASGWWDDLTSAGAYFRSNRAGTGAVIATSVTAFVVSDVQGKQGCSLGPFVDYVTVDKEGVTYKTPTILAHELGHACGLLHRSGQGNLMYAGKDRGERLTRWQKAWLRSSKHVSYL